MNEKEGYDMSSVDDALKLGAELALAWTDTIRRIVDAMEGDEVRIAFFAALLGSQLGAMAACVGHERSKAIMELAFDGADKGAARVAAEQH